MKYVGGKILRLVAIADPAGDICIHPFEIFLVKLGETAAVALRRLDQFPLSDTCGSILSIAETIRTRLRGARCDCSRGRHLPFRVSPTRLQCGISRHTRL